MPRGKGARAAKRIPRRLKGSEELLEERKKSLKKIPNGTLIKVSRKIPLQNVKL
jgi:hypothetical protein